MYALYLLGELLVSNEKAKNMLLGRGEKHVQVTVSPESHAVNVEAPQQM